MLKNVIKFIPAFQGSSAIREVLMTKGIQWFDCADEIKNGYSEYMGLVIKFGDTNVSVMGKVLYMFVAGLILLGIATVVLAHKKQAER